MTWKLIGTLINRKKNGGNRISRLIHENKCFTDQRSISNQFNLHFTSVGARLSESFPSNETDPTKYIEKSFLNSFMFRGVIVNEVQDIIYNLDAKKSTIGIPIYCIKLASDMISASLTEIFNLSLVQGIVPESLKVSRVTPISKGGDPSNPTNYRPISILSTFAQIFERLVYQQLLNYLEKKQILNEFQFGFRKERSTEQSIIEITECFKKSIDQNMYTCSIFLDFAKAFDTVNHQILLNKLQHYGIRGIPLRWFTSYLVDRKQYVQLEEKSDVRTVTCGIPQGSSLGPLLFLIYINDISNSSEKLSFRIFADDTTIFASSANLSDLECLVNSELRKVSKWCIANRLSINLKKTNFMIIKSPKKTMTKKVDIKLLNKENSYISIEKKDHVKFLGVFIDDNLSWKYHISSLCSRLSRNAGIFLKLRHFVSLSQMKSIYYSLVYPHVTYAIVAWGSAYKTHLNKIQVKQNHILRIIFFATLYGKNTESALPLINLLDMLTVENIFKLNCLKFIYLWQTNQLPNIFDNYFEFAKNKHSYNTRYASNNNFYKQKSRTNKGKQCVSAIAPDLWKNIPTNLKDIKNTALFKNKIKAILLDEQNRIKQ